MHIELKSMTRKELEKHLKDVQKALNAAKARDYREARKAAEKAAAEFGFSLDQLADDTAKPRKTEKAKTKKTKVKSKPMFANPDDASQTWTGKGRQPNWFREAVANGASPDMMKI
ncbi:H-NS histone family protein [Sulfitobacter sp. M57]|uniref:H-NS histone family protein n=2 Tax=unclassified Sulfitobacter TaxID=196795 RepID=UPI0023E2D4C8|nr:MULTISPECIES: H-NS histone family protein [unclassified Sulfitobacter]MDF3519315.1 H-NS histone family protein [Sulfitobacter sp. M74]MDF3542743.1 H-NS histone family protein [Sulfitobacter sp. M72]MDF3412877.1 H-NS histone family protein [Sulfitobacter sp. KE5]MDF3421839.1 H-NS histone family protein [Sulfitobacter sp. KE43]MDF3431426.1 H-NS histone family protein [Sulfitobacter sp. KE42]